MPAMAAPLAAEKLDAWESWVAELGGPRKAAFDDMNARHGLTEHRAYLQPTPDGNFLVLVVYEGPGSDGFLASMAQSDQEFDQWFIATVADIHGIDTSGPLPPMAKPQALRARLPRGLGGSGACFGDAAESSATAGSRRSVTSSRPDPVPRSGVSV